MPYTVYQLLWYFFIYAFLGWCLEVVFCTVNSGQWVNRGFLNGPVCPIYGFGMCIVLAALAPLAGSLPLLFAGAFVLTSLLELATGFVLKQAFHTTWWDYSDQPFNLGGYICLKFSLAWGLGGMAAVRLVHPPVARLVERIPHTAGWWLLACLGALLAADLAATLATLAGLERDLRELEKLAAALRKGSDAISHGLGDAALATDEKLAEGKQALPARLAALEARRDLLRAGLTDRRLFGPGRLLRAFPRMRSLRHHELFEALRADLHKKFRR